jgi:hypothetical protein
MLASVAGQKPRRPQFVGIAKLLRLSARQRRQPRLGFECDRRLPTGARVIVQRSHRAFNHGALDSALKRSADAVRAPDPPQTTTGLPGGKAISVLVPPGSPAPFVIALSIQLCRILISERQFNRPPPRCHDLTPSLSTRDLYRNPRIEMNPPRYGNFHGIDRLAACVRRAAPGPGGGVCMGALHAQAGPDPHP